MVEQCGIVARDLDREKPFRNVVGDLEPVTFSQPHTVIVRIKLMYGTLSSLKKEQDKNSG